MNKVIGEEVFRILLEQLAQDRETLRARGLMIEILTEAVKRLHDAGFAPALELADGEALVVLRLDTGGWVRTRESVPDFLRPVSPGPIPRVDLGKLVLPPDDPLRPHPIFQPNTCAVVEPVPDRAPRIAPHGPAGFWTAEKDVELLRLRGAGKTAAEIAEHFGLSRINAVHDRVYQLKKSGVAVPEAVHPRKAFGPARVSATGAVLREWSASDDEALIAGYAGDRPLAEVADDLGRTRSAVAKRLAHLRAQGRITGRRPRATWPGKAAARLAPAPDPGSAPEQKSEPVSEPVGVALEPEPAPQAKAKPDPKPAPVPEPEPAAPPKMTVPRGAGVVSALVRPPTVVRPPPKLLPGMTEAQKRAMIEAHIADLPVTDVWDAKIDLELCEDAFSGRGVGFVAVLLGIDTKAAMARFHLISDPLRRDGVKGLPIEASSLILPALRARLDGAPGGAAA